MGPWMVNFLMRSIGHNHWGNFQTFHGRRRRLAIQAILGSTPVLGDWERIVKKIFEREVKIRHINGLRRKSRLPVRGQRTKSNGMTARRLGLMGDGGS